MAEDQAGQPEITAFWNRVGPRYESSENVAAPGTDEYARWRATTQELLSAASSDVLDVGTGTGFLARLAAELGHRVTAIDVADDMLAASTVRDADGDITFAVGDAVNPPCVAESFDAVVSRSLLWTLREPGRAFASWWRMLRPGGRVVVIYGLAPPGAPDEGPYTAATREQLPAMHLKDHDVPVQAAEGAGFRHISITALQALRGWETSPGSDLPYALIGYRSPPA